MVSQIHLKEENNSKCNQCRLFQMERLLFHQRDTCIRVVWWVRLGQVGNARVGTQCVCKGENTLLQHCRQGWQHTGEILPPEAYTDLSRW